MILRLGPFGLASLAAIIVGAIVCAADGIALGGAWRDLAAWLVGALLAAAIAGRAGGGFEWLWLRATPVLLVASLLSAPQLNVHRWVVAGPFHLNVAMMMLPGAAVALARQGGWAIALVSLLLLAVQPDASQATAWAAAGIVVALLRPMPGWARALLIAALAGGAVLAWTQPDPLPPVPEVEGILRLAAAHFPALAAIAAAALLAGIAAPLATARAGDRPAAGALGMLLAFWTAAPFVGAWIGAGLLARRASPGSRPFR